MLYLKCGSKYRVNIYMIATPTFRFFFISMCLQKVNVSTNGYQELSYKTVLKGFGYSFGLLIDTVS